MRRISSALSERLAEPELIADPDLPRERLWQMRAREVVLATGAIERPLVFADNDRPGIMLADAARRYLVEYGVKVGERVVVVTAHDSAYRAALELQGSRRPRSSSSPICATTAAGPLPEAARAAGISGRDQGRDARGQAAASGSRPCGSRGHPGGMRTIACDALLMSGGWTPSVHLFSQSRGKLAFDEALQVFRPGASVQRERSAGACNAAFGLARSARRGRRGGTRGCLRRRLRRA